MTGSSAFLREEVVRGLHFGDARNDEHAMKLIDRLKALPLTRSAVGLRAFLEKYDRTLFGAAFGVMLLLYLMPLLVARFLPFSDLPGHIGVVGALLQSDDSEASIDAYFRLRPQFGPNSLEFYFTWALGRVFDVVTAAKLFAVLCVASLPISVLCLLRVFRRNHWLVFLVFPFSYPRIMWYGFMGSTLGISLMFGSIAAACVAARSGSVTHSVVVALLLVLTGMSHPFFLAATLPLAALVMVFGLATTRIHRWQRWIAPAAFVPVIVVFWGWYSKVFSGLSVTQPKTGPGFFEHLSANRPPTTVYLQWLKEWSLGAYRGSVESTVLWGLAATYLVCLTFGVAYVGCRSVLSWAAFRGRYEPPATPETGDAAETDAAKTDAAETWSVLQPWRWKAPEGWVATALFVCMLSAFLYLPGVIKQPVYWWAVAQRLVTPLLILCVFLLPRAVPGRFAAVIVLPAILASGYYGTFLTWDFHAHWNGTEMSQFERALRAIPRGKRVLGLYDDREHHYAHFQLHFGSAYYVALRGGFAVPFPAAPGYEKIAWVYPRRMPPGPPWGKLRAFRYRRHGRHYDYFLIKRHADGQTEWRRRFIKRCIEHCEDFGLWTVVKRLKDKGC
jgi:hypothetical protein